MPISPQTANFPTREMHIERSWSENLTAVLQSTQGAVGWNAGGRFTIPNTGLLPSATDGTLLRGPEILGLNLSELIDTAPASAALRKLCFGTRNLYYAPAPANVALGARDAVIAEVSTGASAIQAIGQPLNLGNGLYGLRGLINLVNCVKGADTQMATWTHPAINAASPIQVESVAARIVTAAVSGTDINFKLGATTIATILAANTGTVNFAAIGTPAATWVLAPGTNIALSYNVAAGSPTAGQAEVTMLFRYL